MLKKNWGKVGTKEAKDNNDGKNAFVQLTDDKKPPVVLALNNDRFTRIQDGVYMFILKYDDNTVVPTIETILNSNGYVLMQNQKFAVKEKNVKGVWFWKQLEMVLDMTQAQYDALYKPENEQHLPYVPGFSYYIDNLQPSSNV